MLAALQLLHLLDDLLSHIDELESIAPPVIVESVLLTLIQLCLQLIKILLFNLLAPPLHLLLHLSLLCGVLVLLLRYLVIAFLVFVFQPVDLEALWNELLLLP